MAKLEATIPDGDYCSDRVRFDCVFKGGTYGATYCKQFETFLERKEFKTAENATVRAHEKCEKCLSCINGDTGKGFVKLKDKSKGAN